MSPPRSTLFDVRETPSVLVWVSRVRVFAEKMNNTVKTLVEVFGFSKQLALLAVDSVNDKSDVQLAWNWILDHGLQLFFPFQVTLVLGGEDSGGPVIPTQMYKIIYVLLLLYVS